ncbi:iron ABC transporter permease [Desulfobotulus sp.]|jgi:iron complex transport system permease protein|uniref:FecCD family ABC transporter permease n=1 Tax=Desulfobotulus sp. TaxID=1940337 RepID=UPI002A36847A|nr:iron ABC transporter permease [Desulfobotulus sp.]MDY0162998.1 iron ABC transporter permease [Desulfobotulus sp.]
MHKKRVSHGIFYVGLALAAFFCLPFWGAESTPFGVIFQLLGEEQNVAAEILLHHRFPRVLLAFVCGMGLAACGAALQVMLENPLAEPFVLGIAGCAAVGASLALSFSGLFVHWGPFSSVQLLAFGGAMMAVGLSLKMAARFGGATETVILAGVTVNILCGALMLLIRYSVDPSQLVVMDRWLMGGLDVVGWSNLFAMLPLILIGSVLLFPLGPSLNLMALDAGLALAHGVPVARVRFRICLATGLLVGAAVAVSGPIGFVGLIVPQAVRRISGPDMRSGLVFSALAGGVFLAFCDMLARTLVAPTEMPVGILTAMIGGPLFLRMLWVR